MRAWLQPLKAPVSVDLARCDAAVRVPGGGSRRASRRLDDRVFVRSLWAVRACTPPVTELPGSPLEPKSSSAATAVDLTVDRGRSKWAVCCHAGARCAVVAGPDGSLSLAKCGCPRRSMVPTVVVLDGSSDLAAHRARVLAVDHVVVVHDLMAAARRYYEQTGLASVVGGLHPGHGTGNRIVPSATATSS
jgi:Glyoxalase-like domain